MRRDGACFGLVLLALVWGPSAADPGPAARLEAVGRLTDPALLERICREDGSPDVRAAALARLSDPAVLAALLRSHPDWRVRKAAVGRVQDRAVLAGVAKRDPDPDVREAARRRLDPSQEAAATPPERIRRMLGDPVLVARFGRLQLEADVSEQTRDYTRAGERGKVVVEGVELVIRRGRRSSWRGSTRDGKAGAPKPSWTPG